MNGELEPWNGKADSLAAWIDRLNQLHILNAAPADKKVASLLVNIGQTGYEALANLTYPEVPSKKGYEELIKLLEDHVLPQELTISERSKFYAIYQERTETVREFSARVKRRAATCNFIAEALDQQLRDKFICGLRDERIRAVLIAEDAKLTFAKSVEKANLKHSAAEEARKMASPASNPVIKSEVFAVGDRWEPKRCTKCTLRGHIALDCHTKCFKCEGIGHLAKDCRRGRNQWFKKDSKRPKKEVGLVETEEFTLLNEGELNHRVNAIDQSRIVRKSVDQSEKIVRESIDQSQSLTLPIHREFGGRGAPTITAEIKISEKEPGKTTTFLVDTGAGVSFINTNLFNEFKKCKSVETVRLANGEAIKCCQVVAKVSVGGKEKNCILRCAPGVPNLWGRDLLDTFMSKWSIVAAVEIEEFEKKVREHAVFEDQMGTYKGGEARIQLKPESKPIFAKARPAPFALREPLKKALDEQVKTGVMVRVDTSAWASPIVVVPKPDGAVRVCGDYSATVNPRVDCTTYPLPTTEECFVAVAGGEKFTKIDLKAAYSQIKLNKSDQELLTLNTPFGLYRWTRLPFGLSSSSAIFQRVMDEVLKGIEGTVCRVDDILISAPNDKEHMSRVRQVLERLEKAGLRAKDSKTVIMANKVEYLGYEISREGIKPLRSKVETLARMAFPPDRAKLVTWLGAVGYYSRFIRNLATLSEPLNQLRSKDAPWVVGEREKRAFREIQKQLTSTGFLAVYRPELPLVLDCDASCFGLGGVLSQVENGIERPIEFISRKMTSAERNYSQIEREALSIVWAVNRLHQYLYAREFKLRTDHKPLVVLFGPKKDMKLTALGRVQRWGLILAQYRYIIEFRKTEEHANADLCSRFPLEYSGESWTAGVPCVNNVEKSRTLDLKWVAEATRRDPILSRVVRYTQNGWPERVNPELEAYACRKVELTVEAQCVMWGARVIVPAKLQKRVLELLHAVHMGVSAMKRLAREHLWYPGMDKEIEKLARECEQCGAASDRPPAGTRERIHIDFCLYEDTNWLVIVDSYSRWVEVVKMGRTTAEKTIQALKRLFATFGIPTCIVSDNGPQFVSHEFKIFTENNKIKHITSAPYSPKSNGAAEAAVGTFKRAMKKSPNVPIDLRVSQFLLYQHATPAHSTGECPSSRMLNRKVRTRLSFINPLDQPRVTTPMKRRELNVGQEVRCDVRGKWEKGVVLERKGEVMYKVRCAGREMIKHIDQIRAVMGESAESEERAIDTDWELSEGTEGEGREEEREVQPEVAEGGYDKRKLSMTESKLTTRKSESVKDDTCNMLQP
eukprot:sb/3461083/